MCSTPSSRPAAEVGVGILPPSLVAAFVNSIGVNPDMAQKRDERESAKSKFSFDRDDHSFT